MSKAAELKKLYAELEAAVSHLPLATKPDDIVPGEGNAEAKIMFIGEAPGYNEAVQRRPFVGKSGQLFRNVLQEQSGIDPSTVYISNIVKVRPPDNRDPSPAEIAAYKPFLDKEIEIIQPLVITTLGRLSMGKFLPDVKISQVHGRLHKIMWEGKRLFVLPMFHPAAALRATNVKESFIKDLQKLPKVIEWIEAQQAGLELEDTIKESLL
jgi:uracil-DNA glycosylase